MARFPKSNTDESGRLHTNRRFSQVDLGRLFGGTSFLNARSNDSPDSSTPSFRAVSLNCSDCSSSVLFRLFSFWFCLWALGHTASFRLSGHLWVRRFPTMPLIAGERIDV